MPKPNNRGANELGALLRQWRSARNRSQIELSLDTEVSQRHLSFIEVGRSVPSRETLMIIADALDIPYRDRNSLLLAAGYAPMYHDCGWDSQQLHSVSAALGRMLRQHEPYPAIVLDRYWNVLQTNTAAPHFFNSFVDLSARPQPRNLLHLMFDPLGMRPFVANWEQVAPTLIARVYREAVGRFVDEKSQDLISTLLAYPGAKPEWRTPDPRAVSDLPVIPIRFSRDAKILSYFSMLTTFATPQVIATQELRIESMFPMDEITEAHHARIMGNPDPAFFREARC
jgi:transcriptional regulator with XRE-family HTH domain